VRYELDFISQKTAFFIVTAVKTSNLMRCVYFIDSRNWTWKWEDNKQREEERSINIFQKDLKR
jgi:hypothetical protein